jgi:hypothetical protein
VILLLLLAVPPEWSAADDAELAPIREAFGFSEGLRAIDADAVPSESCGACHRQVYREWKSSRHSMSTTNEIFREGFLREPSIRCVRCHAPLPEQAKPFRRWLRERRFGASELAVEENEGIGCAVCHVRDGVVLTSRPIATPEHPTRFEPLLADARFCAGCHQFRFEKSHGAGAELTDHVTQDTWREWRSTGTDDCMSCHMDEHGHRFPGAHDLELLRASIDFVVREGVLELRSIGVGHRLPTGDLFRHLILEIDDGGWKPIAWIGRRFEVVEEGGRHVKRMAEDTTLAPGETRRFRVGAARVRLRYGYSRDASIVVYAADGHAAANAAR